MMHVAEESRSRPPETMSSVERRYAVRRLEASGCDAVPAICQALRDSDLGVRILAADALGRIGDERAIAPLNEALQACFIGGGGVRRRAYSWIAKAASAGMLIGIALLRQAGPAHAFVDSATSVVMVAGFIWVMGPVVTQRRKARLCRGVMVALEAIAERRPTAEMRLVLPSLETIGDDFLVDKPVARDAREVAKRIKEATEHLKDIPLPSVAPAPQAAALPRVVGPREDDPQQLPRIMDNPPDFHA